MKLLLRLIGPAIFFFIIYYYVDFNEFKGIVSILKWPYFFMSLVLVPPLILLRSNRWKNILEKVRTAANIDNISDEFLLMNDDFFMLTEFNGAEFPFYAVKNGQGGCNGKNDFSIHCPIRIKKDWYMQLPLTLDMKGDWSPRSFYCNFFGAPAKFTDDCIVREGETMPSFSTQVTGKDWFSISNGTMQNTEMSTWLSYLFPEKSKYEI